MVATPLKQGAFRDSAIAFFCEQIVEQSSWVAIILFAYNRSGAKSAGIYTSAILLFATFLSPLQSRLLERFAPFGAAQAQLTLLAASSLAVSLSLAVRAPALISWAAIVIMLCAETSGPAVLFALLPSTARNTASLAHQNVIFSWIESASLVVGPIVAAVMLGLSKDVESGLMIVTGIGAFMLVISLLLIQPHAKTERREDAHAAVRTIAKSESQPNQTQFTERELIRLSTIRTLMIITLGSYLTIGSLDVLFVSVAGTAGIGTERAGYLAAAYGVGGLVSLLFAKRFVGRSRLVAPLCWFGAAGSATLLAIAFFRTSLAGTIILIAASGATRAIFGAVRRVLVQRSSPAGSMLRVAGLFQVVVTLGYALGALIPWLAGSTVRACVATGLLLPAGLALAASGLRRVDDDATVPVTEIALLSRVTILRSLRPESLEALARQSHNRTYDTGTDIISEGDIGTELFVMVEGSVEVLHQGSRLNTLRRGDVFGEIALVRNQTRSATVTALEESEVLAVPGTAFLELVGMHTGVADAVEGLISQRP